MNVLIVEDERPALRRLERLVSEHPALTRAVIHTAESVDAATTALRGHECDLLLLDLDLAGQDGFGLVRQLRRGTPVVVVSAMEHRAIEAFDLGITDFVSKPVGEARLSRAIARALTRETPEFAASVAVRAHGRVELMQWRDVVCIASADDYSRLHHRDGRALLHDEQLHTLEPTLPSSFLRVHRGWIVNLDHVSCVRAIDGKRHVVECRNGSRVPVSRRRGPQVLDAIRRWTAGTGLGAT